MSRYFKSSMLTSYESVLVGFLNDHVVDETHFVVAPHKPESKSSRVDLYTFKFDEVVLFFFQVRPIFFFSGIASI